TSKESTDQLILALDDPSSGIRIRALKCLRRIGKDASDATSKVIPKMDDTNPDVRAHAVTCLASICPDNPEILPKIINLAEKDPKEYVRKHSLRTIATINPDKLAAVKYLCSYSETAPKRELRAYAKRVSDNALRRYLIHGIPVNKDSNTEFARIVLAPEFVHDNGHIERSEPVKEHGILPIRISIDNLSPSKIRLDSEDIKMSAPDRDNTTLDILSPQEATFRMGYSMNKAIANAIIFGPFGWGSPYRTAKANRIITSHNNEAAIDEGEIEPRSSMTGYVFIDVPRRLESILGYTFDIKLRDMLTNDIYEVTIIFGKSVDISIIKGERYATSVAADRLTSPEVTKINDIHNVDFKTKLSNLKILHDEGLITAEEYADKKKSLLSDY
ncbi:HEAT repeat domain-containing protein, partial [Planctomycetota bacterium]